MEKNKSFFEKKSFLIAFLFTIVVVGTTLFLIFFQVNAKSSYYQEKNKEYLQKDLTNINFNLTNKNNAYELYYAIYFQLARLANIDPDSILQAEAYQQRNEFYADSVVIFDIVKNNKKNLIANYFIKLGKNNSKNYYLNLTFKKNTNFLIQINISQNSKYFKAINKSYYAKN